MFSQVQVDEDRDTLRFLWFKDGDLNQLAETYQMKTQLLERNCALAVLPTPSDEQRVTTSRERTQTP